MSSFTQVAEARFEYFKSKVCTVLIATSEILSVTDGALRVVHCQKYPSYYIFRAKSIVSMISRSYLNTKMM